MRMQVPGSRIASKMLLGSLVRSFLSDLLHDVDDKRALLIRHARQKIKINFI